MEIGQEMDLINRLHPHVFIVVETRLSLERAEDIAYCLFFDEKIIISSLNHAGGIGVLWNSQLITLSQVQSCNRSVHALVTVNHGVSPFFLSAIYNNTQMHMQTQV